MALKLVKLTKEYRPQLNDMMEEWLSKEHSFSPKAIIRNDYRDFDDYLAKLERKEPADGYVPNSVFFALDTERNIFVGAADIRHRLNDSLLVTGGHIADGIRPSERRKGYATKVIGLALEECRKLGISRVLMTCDRDNIGSAKSIMNNGGVLENEVINEEGIPEQRYWIELSSVRYAEEEDRAFWYTLDRHLPEEEFGKKVRDRQAYILLKGETPVGVLRYNLFWDNTPMLTMLYIRPELQRTGLGRSFMEYWENDLRRLGYGMAMTTTQADEQAQHFYRKLGYKDCGGITFDLPGYEQPMELVLSKDLRV